MMYSNILVPVDISYSHSEWLKPSLTVAQDIAKQTGAHVHFLTVMPDNLLKGYYPDLDVGEIHKENMERLKNIVEGYAPDIRNPRLHAGQGGICHEIIRFARALPVDLIVMASHGPILRDYLLGSNAAYVALHTPYSVFIVRDRNIPLGATQGDVSI